MQHDDNTTRRTVLAVAAGGAAVAASGAARAQQPGTKGPLVWLDMDQQALDDAYDQVVYAPNREQVAKRRVANSDKARAVIGTPERAAYGVSERKAAKDGLRFPPSVIRPDCQPPTPGSSLSRNQSIMSMRGFARAIANDSFR